MRNKIQDGYAKIRALRMMQAGMNPKLMNASEIIAAYFKAFGATINNMSAELIVELSQDIEAFTCGECNKFYKTSDCFHGVNKSETAFICKSCAE